MLFNLFNKKMKEDERFIDFPLADEKIISGPSIRETDQYIRATYKMKNVDNYIEKIQMNGFQKRSDVKYESYNGYIIIEKEFGGYKVALHKRK